MELRRQRLAKLANATDSTLYDGNPLFDFLGDALPTGIVPAFRFASRSWKQSITPLSVAVGPDATLAAALVFSLAHARPLDLFADGAEPKQDSFDRGPDRHLEESPPMRYLGFYRQPRDARPRIC